jgi:hypothetical protein
MTSFTAPSAKGEKQGIVSSRGSTPSAELYVSMSKTSGGINPVVDGAFALLRTSLTSMLWWPLRNPSTAGDLVRTKRDRLDTTSVW